MEIKTMEAKKERERPRLLTVKELSTYLALPVSTIYTWTGLGRIPGVVRLGKALRFDRAEIDLWVLQKQASSGGSEKKVPAWPGAGLCAPVGEKDVRTEQCSQDGGPENPRDCHPFAYAVGSPFEVTNLDQNQGTQGGTDAGPRLAEREVFEMIRGLFAAMESDANALLAGREGKTELDAAAARLANSTLVLLPGIIEVSRRWESREMRSTTTQDKSDQLGEAGA
jgi:excisionase family DNA binding protein